MITYPDACPKCDPFDSSASLPTAISSPAGNAWYQCEAGHVWHTRRDGFGWVMDRWVVSGAQEAA